MFPSQVDDGSLGDTHMCMTLADLHRLDDSPHSFSHTHLHLEMYKSSKMLDNQSV